jgi:LAGLIDADG DNA endonuclease family protein
MPANHDYVKLSESPSEVAAGFLAGLIAGEGCFTVAPNNGGQSWMCAFSLAMRADDTPLLCEVTEMAGCGALEPVEARGASRPQMAWRVRSITDCLELARVLDAAPLLAKKAGDFAIWRRALEVWADGPRAGRWTTMKSLARDLRRHREMSTSSYRPPVDITRPHLDGFLSGFATAEGHFGATSDGHPYFTINLRADDLSILADLRRMLDVGRVVLADGDPNVMASLRVARRPDLVRLLEQFSRVPPRGHKAAAYDVWRELVRTIDTRAPRIERKPLVKRLRATRSYEPPASAPTRDRAEERRRRCVSALQGWASNEQGLLTVAAYERFREATSDLQLPTRNTVARIFGSWRAAMIAAGLPTRASRSPARIDKARHTGIGPLAARGRVLPLAARACT